MTTVVFTRSRTFSKINSFFRMSWNPVCHPHRSSSEPNHRLMLHFSTVCMWRHPDVLNGPVATSSESRHYVYPRKKIFDFPLRIETAESSVFTISFILYTHVNLVQEVSISAKSTPKFNKVRFWDMVIGEIVHYNTIHYWDTVLELLRDSYIYS